MQMEFVRIGPFVKVTMDNKGKTGRWWPTSRCQTPTGCTSSRWTITGWVWPDYTPPTRWDYSVIVVVLILRSNFRFLWSPPSRHVCITRGSSLATMVGVCISSMVILHYKVEEFKKEAGKKIVLFRIPIFPDSHIDGSEWNLPNIQPLLTTNLSSKLCTWFFKIFWYLRVNCCASSSNKYYY